MSWNIFKYNNKNNCNLKQYVRLEDRGFTDASWLEKLLRKSIQGHFWKKLLLAESAAYDPDYTREEIDDNFFDGLFKRFDK